MEESTGASGGGAQRPIGKVTLDTANGPVLLTGTPNVFASVAGVGHEEKCSGGVTGYYELTLENKDPGGAKLDGQHGALGDDDEASIEAQKRWNSFDGGKLLWRVTSSCGWGGSGTIDLEYQWLG